MLIASRPPRKWVMVGDGMVTFGVLLDRDFRYLKFSTSMPPSGSDMRSLTVTFSGTVFSSPAPRFVPSSSARWKVKLCSIPPIWSMKSTWKLSRRYSPSVMP